MSMMYISTRGECPPLGFHDVMMSGLARDGGLFLPSAIPDARANLAEWMRLSYRELAFEVMRPFVDIPEADFRFLIDRSYSSFRHPDVTPVVSPAPALNILELFHGPTLAFKDVALQLLGNLFEYSLSRRSRSLNLLAATSGDTGSAAICGVRGKKGMRIFVLYPHGRISPIQERQMTTVADDNVFCIAVEGSFDDCQAIVKEIFRDLDFRDRNMLGAVNSINWARILAQIVYYFFGAFRVMETSRAESARFAVPTGNFGDIFAGYIAARMGLPIGLLILACNENDILSRFFNTGIYERGKVRRTISPSMDIQVASNFERYLYYLLREDAAAVRRLMKQFDETGRLKLDMESLRSDDVRFAAGSSSSESSLAEIKRCYEENGYLLDPHTAAGVRVAASFRSDIEPTICLATAHPAKFGEAVRKAVGKDVARHEMLAGLNDLPARRTILPASVEAIKGFVETHSR